MSLNYLIKVTAALIMLAATSALAAPYSAIVVEPSSGKVLHAENHDMRLHPAGLTKLMTLYTAFSAIKNGEVTLDDLALVSKNAALEAPVKLGLRDSQKIKLRYLIRAIGIQGANDASTALGEYIAGSEDAFAKRMQVYSDELGLTRSTWRNQHGRTASQHLSTARDIASLLIALKRDFPDYYNLFRRQTEDAGMRQVKNSASRLLIAIPGITGAKYGYTRAAGFSAAVSVKRRGREIVVVVFGARSTASLLARVEQLTDLGFKKIN